MAKTEQAQPDAQAVTDLRVPNEVLRGVGLGAFRLRGSVSDIDRVGILSTPQSPEALTTYAKDATNTLEKAIESLEKEVAIRGGNPKLQGEFTALKDDLTAVKVLAEAAKLSELARKEAEAAARVDTIVQLVRVKYGVQTQPSKKGK